MPLTGPSDVTVRRMIEPVAWAMALARERVSGPSERTRKASSSSSAVMVVKGASMGEHQIPGEQLTWHLLAGESQHTEEVRGELNSTVCGEEKPDSYFSSVTGVLLFSSFIAVCGSLNYGLAVGYSSPVKSGIIDDLDLSTEEYSLFGSFLTVGGAVGSIACGKMSDYLGRRVTFGVSDVLSIAGWFAIVAAEGALPLYLGRLLLGFAVGLGAYVVSVYVAEITPKDIRGGFAGLNMLMLCTGITIAYILGVFVSWRFLAALGIIPNILQLIGLFFIPESPRWLVKVHKETKFKVALQRLRGPSADVSTEAAEVKEYTVALEKTSKVSIIELFQRKYAYGLTVGMGLFALAQLDGIHGITFYASSIFKLAGLSTRLGSIVMATVKVPAAFTSLLLIDKFGRRTLLMVSASGLCLACLLVGITFVLKDHGWLEGPTPYLALLGLLMYTACYSMGMGGIPYLLISEIYPINIKGLAGSMATFVGWLTSWFVSYTFNFFLEWSSAGTFFILTGICAFTVVFVVILVPETKGRTLEEIQISINQMFRSDQENQRC